MEIVVSEKLGFLYSKNFLRIRFFGIELKIGTDLHNTLSENWSARFLNFHKVLKWHQSISDKNNKKIPQYFVPQCLFEKIFLDQISKIW